MVSRMYSCDTANALGSLLTANGYLENEWEIDFPAVRLVYVQLNPHLRPLRVIYRAAHLIYSGLVQERTM